MELITSKLCLTKNLGVNSNLFGGDMLAFIDEAAAIFCTEYCQTETMVTLKMSEVIFKKSVKEGDLVRIYGEMLKIGNTSCEVRIEAKVRSVFTKEEELVCSTNVTFVRVDKKGRSRPIDGSVKERYVKENLK